MKPGQSTHMSELVRRVASQLGEGRTEAECGYERLLATRNGRGRRVSQHKQNTNARVNR